MIWFGVLNRKNNLQSFFSLKIFRPCIKVGYFGEFNLKYMCILETNASDRFSEHVKDSENNYHMGTFLLRCIPFKNKAVRKIYRAFNEHILYLTIFLVDEQIPGKIYRLVHVYFRNP